PAAISQPKLVSQPELAVPVASTAPAVRLPALAGEVWWLPGFTQVEAPQPVETQLVLTELTRLKPQIVLVAFGAPYQEAWISTHSESLKTAGVRLAMTVGGALDFILGKVPRAPQSWRQLGLEWLYRLFHQSWRWRRQLALFEFVWLVIAGQQEPKSVQPKV
ncbi:MAG TPA: hypothetical protein DEP87_00395, partial [Candidatus Pacebacteria bacterium]|nr:hypothetical protein [Candidatus Paceibacterota bacterium]